ncbi:hypothetical protein BDV93DRAFT_525280 [Ceratobasidium sp. AG-I]|nr:hypothetical protein BDV93DRAFT_525280 [Ceratobasidium sp. AG-I]
MHSTTISLATATTYRTHSVSIPRTDSEMRQTRSSARKVEKAKTPSGVDDAAPDPDVVDAEQVEDDSEYDEPKEPKPKRQRTSQVAKAATRKKQVRGKQGRLAGLMKMPIDIFTEIALYLMPGDIIVLARSNKFFRNLLMNRSAAHIWHGVMRNVPQLPPCPPEMCEPQYLALIYSRTCSMCGKNVTRRMDEVLRVRLCGSCRNTSTVLRRGLPIEVQPLVHYSTKIVPSKRRWGGELYCLRSDVDEVLLEVAKLEKAGNVRELGAWKAEREEEVAARRLHSTVLKAFLDHLESQGHSEKNGLKSERRNEIERRLIEIGWEQKDLRFGYFERREWDQLVEQPKPLTERIWTNIKPKLIPLLERNRDSRLANEKAQRKYARKMKLSQLLNNIKHTDSPLIDTDIMNPTPSSIAVLHAPIVRVSHQRLFPLTVDLLEHPIMKSLDETDETALETEARFQEHREEIDSHILEWRLKIEGHMAELLRKGRKADGLEQVAPAPVLPVKESEPNPFDNISEDLKILLRADSLFEADCSLSTPVNYNTLLAAPNFSVYSVPRERPLDLARYKRHAEAQQLARILLAGMGKPDASFLELKSVGPRFMCGRCHSDSVFEWEEIVAHYIAEKRAWERIHARLPEAEKLGITFKNVHAFDAETDRPLTKIVNMQQYANYVSGQGSSNFKCLLCIKVGGLPDVRDSVNRIVDHVSQVHGIANPEEAEHYDKFGGYFHEFYMSDDDEESFGHDGFNFDGYAYDSDDW